MELPSVEQQIALVQSSITMADLRIESDLRLIALLEKDLDNTPEGQEPDRATLQLLSTLRECMAHTERIRSASRAELARLCGFHLPPHDH